MKMPPEEADKGLPDSAADDVVPAPGLGLYPIVGLGGSAGAITSLKKFFHAMPADSGMVFAVIMHLAPKHESALAELLQRATTMPVLQVNETVKVEPNTVYVIPPGKVLSSVDGYLRLQEADREPGRHVAVDIFFRTLAENCGSKATAIVLSGADGDGAIGIKRIKERGGLTIAQDPEEAEHSGMPQAAIATGMVDWVLPAGEMGGRLMEYGRIGPQIRLPPEKGPQPAQPSPAPRDDEEAALRDVLAFLRSRTGRDFAGYKRATILRRIGRRMQVNGISSLHEYLGWLRTRPGETGALLQDLLISVTNFFRDAECFSALEARLPALLAGKTAGDTVRVWVPACATGEEAYTMAMLLSEQAQLLPSPPQIQVFATDLDEQAIHTAREGCYPATIEADVSAERLRRFFTKEHRGYRVKRELRESVLFAVHDLLKDSPFSRLDLVSCRNLLIYLNREAQARVFDTLHFALRPTGLLFLGASETAEDSGSLFAVLDKKHRIYRPLPAHRTSLPVPAGGGSAAFALSSERPDRDGPVVFGRAFDPAPQAANAPAPRTGPRGGSWGELHLKLLERLAPPSLLIDAHHDIVYLSPSAGRFLQLAGGEPSNSLLRSVLPALRIELRAALYQAEQSHESVEVRGVPIELDGEPVNVDLRVMPAADVAPGLLLVTMETGTPSDGRAAAATRDIPEPLARQLDHELERLKLHLRDTVEQHEASTEELKASNEELQAMNEELRSASEELETSREELQSINEELSTVNQELKSKVDELGHANSDMHNLMDATAIATVFLDRELRIKRYTPSAVQLFHLIPTDVGRPLAHLSTRLDYGQLGDDAAQALEHLATIEREVSLAGEAWYLARMRPYRTLDDRIAGVVLTCVDITDRRRAEEAMRASEERLHLVIENARDFAIFSMDVNRNITGWNNGAERLLGYRETEVLGVSADIIFTEEDRAAGTSQREAATALAEGRSGDDRFHQRKDGSRFWASGVMMAMRDRSNETIGLVKILRDQTLVLESRQALERSERELIRALEENELARGTLQAGSQAKDRFMAVLSHELRTPLTPILNAVHMLSRRPDVPDAVREQLEMIRRNVRTEAHLIDDLLDLTRIERGRFEVVREPIDLHAVVREAIDVCEGDLKAKRQGLHVALNAARSQLQGDAHRLRQAVWNLLKNASKFTPEGGDIRVNTVADEHRIVLEVSDTGIGIDADTLPGIFDEFEQGGDWVNRKYGGLGLGLAISKATVQAHDGTLAAASAGRGHGATFTLELPLMEG